MPQAQQNRKRRKAHVYLDPSRFTCTACRASFKLAAGLKRHYAQRRDCQPDSDSDADNSVENVTFLGPSTLGAPLQTGEGSLLELEVDPTVDWPDATDIPISGSTDLHLDAGNIEMFDYSLDISGDMGEDAWMGGPEPEPEVSNTLNTESASRANTMVPPDPSRIADVFEEQYPGAGHVISHGTT